ncbi:MAG: hypothetical protein GY780_05260 [bacterium]|nr:hypothetical protein [bacterium]
MKTKNLQSVAFIVVALFFAVIPSSSSLADPCPQPPARTDVFTNIGNLGLSVTNLGYIGNSFSTRNPSGRYPLNSNVEHVYSGGIWVGAINANGEARVSTGSQDANGVGQGNELREFDLIGICSDEALSITSNLQNFPNYSRSALANQHIECNYNDFAQPEGGGHSPLGIKINQRTLAWGNAYANDFVILNYRIVNISGEELRELYLGLWVDTTVGNTEQTDPYDGQAAVPWNYYDDFNGAWGAEGFVDPAHTPESDPNIWMAYEHDDDGEEGMATSWIGYRLLGTSEEPNLAPGQAPVSYNSWGFRHVPQEDDWYYDADDPDELVPGKYQIMSNGDFDVGETQEADYSIASNWVGILSTGPFPSLAPDDTISITFAVVAGVDSLSLLENSKVAQIAYIDQFSVPSGPPSPIIDFQYDSNTVKIQWAPGDSLDADNNVRVVDDPLRSPEHHISTITGQYDFQGYRVYRFQGENFTLEPEDESQIVAQFDIVDGRGFDTGLPPLNENGLREFVDHNLLNGFPYQYAVTSFSAPNELEQLKSFESGWQENGTLIYPGPAPSGSASVSGIGVFPNPYRASSLFDGQTGELEKGRKIWFTGLPAHCKIQVFNLMGEVVKTLHHDDPSLGMESWNTLTEHGRALATGLYIYAVTDLDTNEVNQGKLVIIK